MADAYKHAVSSANTFGGIPEDYVEIHRWFDESKDWMPDVRHRAMRHHTLGIHEAIIKFGSSIDLTGGKKACTRMVAEQHVREDLGKIPTVQDWLKDFEVKGWMVKALPIKGT